MEEEAQESDGNFPPILLKNVTVEHANCHPFSALAKMNYINMPVDSTLRPFVCWNSKNVERIFLKLHTWKICRPY
jgi:hypothetical protein